LIFLHYVLEGVFRQPQLTPHNIVVSVDYE